MVPFRNDRTWLAWLVKARVVIITLLLGVEVAVATFTPMVVPKGPFTTVIVLWYVVAGIYIALASWWPEVRVQGRLQVLTDVAFATALLYVTGGIDTPFSFLYPLVIIIASVALPRYWAYLTAALSFIAFGAIVELSFFGLIRSYSVSRPDPKSLQAFIVINLLAYLAIAYLASHLAARLRNVHVQLEETSGALENLQALHASIVQSMTGGVMTTSLDGVIWMINPAGTRLLDRASEELIGMHVSSLFTDPLPEVPEDTIRAELRAVTPAGERKIFGVNASPLMVADRGKVGYVYTFAELTQIRRLEAEVRMRDRMAAVGRMAAGIAHEIRNPLSSIAGSAAMLQEGAVVDEDQRALLEIVRRESERLNKIVTDFVAYSKGRECHFDRHDLLALLEDALRLLENRPEVAGGVQLVRRYEVEHAWAQVDGDRMKQVFWNLCDNALRAIGTTGTLTVTVRGAADRWLIGFADTGCGLPAQQVERVFEPFQKAFERGTGLGLAIVYDIVQAHDAKILVQSTQGKGTEFIVELRQLAPQIANAAGAGRTGRG